MIQSLRDAINNGKTSGQIQNITLTYSIPNLEPILVDHPRTEGVRVLPGTYITADAFDVEIINSFSQWSYFINELYKDYVVLTFEKVESNADVTIEFNASLTGLHMVHKNTRTIELNLGINWNLVHFTNGVLLLNYVVYGIGKLLGIQNTNVLSPMSFDHLNINYVNLFDLNVSDSGYVQQGYIKNYHAIIIQTMFIFGDVFGNPMIFGCTDPNSTNYNPDATHNDFSCIPLPVSPDQSIRPSLRYNGSFDEYFLANNSEIYAYGVGTFESPMLITDINNNTTTLPLGFSDELYPLTSLVITDKAPGTYGDSSGQPRYYIVLSHAGDINVFNKDGQLLSGMPNYSSTDVSAIVSYYVHNMNINYQPYGTDRHSLSWITKRGEIKRLILNDTLAQLNDQGQTVAACDLDTYTHGNIEANQTFSTIGSPITDINGDYLTVNEQGQMSSIIDTNLEDDVFEAKYVGIAYQSLLGNYVETMQQLFDPLDSPKLQSDPSNFTVHQDISNLKTCFIPTIDGVKALSVDLFGNFLQITNLDLGSLYTGSHTHAVWAGDIDIFASGQYQIDDSISVTRTIYGTNAAPSNIDYDFKPTTNETLAHDSTARPLITRNTNADCHPHFGFDPGQILLRPFSKGFSFETTSIYNISDKEWSNGEFSIGEAPIDHSLFASLPITLGNKLHRSFFCDITKISYLSWAVPVTQWASDYEFYQLGFINSEHAEAIASGNTATTEEYNNLRHVGDFHLAIAVKHGFILTKVNNTNFSLVSPTTENGIELHVSGGNPSMESFNGGWTPISMEFSPHDTYLYAIIQNPLDSSDRRLAIYNIHSGGGIHGCTLGQLDSSISNDAIVIDIEEMDLEKVTLQDDGSIYIWSAVNDYIKIPDPDLRMSVDLFRADPQIYIVSGSTYTPSRSYLHNALDADLDMGPKSSISVFQYTASDARIKYAEVFNSSEPSISIGEGITLINNFEYNSKFIGSGFTFDSISNTVSQNVEVDNTVPEAAAVQTANNLNLGIVAYIIENDGYIVLKGYDGTPIIAYDATAESYDFKDSVFITSSESGINDYLFGYADGAAGSYTVKSFAATINADDLTSYSYELNSNTATLTNSINGNYAFIHGARILKTDLEQDKLLFLRTVTDVTSTENKKEIYLTLAEYTNNGFETSDSIIPIHNILSDKLSENASTFSISGIQLYTTIAVSRDNNYIAIGTMSKSANHLHTELSLSVYHLDITADINSGNVIGSQVGITAKMDVHLTEDYGDSFVPMTNSIIRGLEFSNFNTTDQSYKLYCLIGKHGSYASTTIEGLSKSNRIVRFKLTADVLSFDGPLVNQQTFPEPEGTSVQNFVTFTDGVSDQGNSFYANNSAPIGLFLNAEGEIFISNIITSQLYRPNAPEEKVIFVGGYVSDSPSSNSRLFRTACIKSIFDEVRSIRSAGYSALVPSGAVGGVKSGGPGDFEEFEDPTIEILPPVATQGCTDPTAVNYNPWATIDDGSCLYESGVGNCFGTCTGDGFSLLNLFADYYGNVFYDMLEEIQNVSNNFCGLSLTLEQISDLLNQDTGGQVLALALFQTFKNPYCNCSCTYYAEFIAEYSFQSFYDVTTEDVMNYGNEGSLPWFTNILEAEAQGYPLGDICSVNLFQTTSKYYYIPTQGYSSAINAQNINLGTDPFVTGSDEQLVLLGGIVGGTQGTGAISPGYANVIHIDDWNEDYCRTCTDPGSPNYVGITPEACEQADQFCFDDPAYCGAFGCTDQNACNYMPAATVNDGSCQYAPSGINSYGTDVGVICGCPGIGAQENGFNFGYYASSYCGGCLTEEERAELREKSEFCNCDGTTVPTGNPSNQGMWGIAHYCDCEGQTPSDIAENAGEYGCICDQNGNLSNYSTGGQFPVGICDCYGSTSLGPGCSCGEYTSQDDWADLELLDYDHWCDCNTPAALWYPKNTDGSYTAHCDAVPLKICQSAGSYGEENNPTVNWFHGYEGDLGIDDTLSTDVYIDISTGTQYSLAQLEADYFQGPLNELMCFDCALDGPNGEPQEYNCNGDCKYFIGTGSEDLEITINPLFSEYAINEDCGQCLHISQAGDCCNVDENGEQILDVCGQCINLIPNGGITVTNVLTASGEPTGSFEVRKTNTSGTVVGVWFSDCNPCAEAGGPITPEMQNNANWITNSQFLAYGNYYQPDDCQQCAGTNEMQDDDDRFTGYIKYEFMPPGDAGAIDMYRCNCDEVGFPIATIIATETCCPGYTWSPCSNGGEGGCVGPGYPVLTKDCAGNCPTGVYLVQDPLEQEYVYPYGINSCGECTAMINEDTEFTPGTPEYLLAATPMETFNAVGCCGDQVLACQDGCQDPNEALEEDQCGVCGGDNSSCSGCTDSTAFNYNPNATIDDGSCVFTSLLTIIEETTSNHVFDYLNPSLGQNLNLESVFFIEGLIFDTATLTAIQNNPIVATNSALSDTFGETIYIDQPYYTQKCQVITTTNTVLHLNNPLANAEISYTDIDPINNDYIAQHSSYANIQYQGDAQFYTTYYFRLEANLAEMLTETDINVIFGGQYADQVASVTHCGGGISVTASYATMWLEFNEASPLQTGVLEEDANHTVYNVYKVRMSVNPVTGEPYTTSIDFAQYLDIPVFGCTVPYASNWNPAATQDDGSCEYTFPESGFILTINGYPNLEENLKWVLYDANNKLVAANWGEYPTTFADTGSYSTYLPTANSCLYFIPLGFRYNDAWLDVTLKISDLQTPILVLHEGANMRAHHSNDIDNRGTALIDRRPFSLFPLPSCTVGCTETTVPNTVKTDYCISYVKQDEKEFTDISFKLEIGKPITTRSHFQLRLYNLDTAETLIDFKDIEDINIATSYVKEFAIDSQTRVGIYIHNREEVPLKYEMVSEYGEIIIKKKLN